MSQPKGVDEAVGSSSAFSLQRWQTHINYQVQDIVKAYKGEVALKIAAQHQHDQMSKAF